MKKLLIFDCDGVLVDSEIIANRIESQILTRLGYPVSVEESIKRFTGMNTTAVQKAIFDDSGMHIDRDILIANHENILEILEKEVQPLMLPLLSHPSLKTIDKCVASSSIRKRVLMTLGVTKQISFFQEEHVFTSEQVKHGKPAPDLFLLAADKMGYHPKDCLVIEDSLVGIEAAFSAKMPVIGFLGGTHARFDWYKERIQNKKVPIAHTSLELLPMISDFIGQAA